MRAPFMPPRMRREFFRRMLSEMGGPGWRGHPGWHHDCGERPSTEQRIAFLEEYQRDLEQQVADIATKIRRLKEEMTAAETADSDSD